MPCEDQRVLSCYYVVGSGERGALPVTNLSPHSLCSPLGALLIGKSCLLLGTTPVRVPMGRATISSNLGAASASSTLDSFQGRSLGAWGCCSLEGWSSGGQVHFCSAVQTVNSPPQVAWGRTCFPPLLAANAAGCVASSIFSPKRHNFSGFSLSNPVL